MGLLPPRPLTAVTETLDAVRHLLAETVLNRRTGVHNFGNIQLAFPPTQPAEL
jgi:hypothetical protein